MMQLCTCFIQYTYLLIEGDVNRLNFKTKLGLSQLVVMLLFRIIFRMFSLPQAKHIIELFRLTVVKIDR